MTAVDNRVWSGSDDKVICIWNPEVRTFSVEQSVSCCLTTAQNFSLERVLDGHKERVLGCTAFGSYVWSYAWREPRILVWHPRVRLLSAFFFLSNYCPLDHRQ